MEDEEEYYVEEEVLPKKKKRVKLNHKVMKQTRFETITRGLSFAVLGVLLVVDKGMGLMVSPPNEWYYGVLMGYSVVGKSIIEQMIDKVS